MALPGWLREPLRGTIERPGPDLHLNHSLEDHFATRVARNLDGKRAAKIGLGRAVKHQCDSPSFARSK